MAAKFEGWAIVELLGHRRLGGFVREETLFGVAMVRIDIPSARDSLGVPLSGNGETIATQYYSPSALYALTPASEEAARIAAAHAQPAPVKSWEIPARALPAAPSTHPSHEPMPGDEEAACGDEVRRG